MSVQYLPCLRCGEWGVVFLPHPRFKKHFKHDPICGKRDCENQHHLEISIGEKGRKMIYDHYTPRYPLEYYDSHIDHHVPVTFGGKNGVKKQYGPITFYYRKAVFSRSEVKAIWNKTRGHCHLCKRPWALSERGLKGWHIDHKIPNAGGGETELMDNFYVACATCNLKKGRGSAYPHLNSSIQKLLLNWEDICDANANLNVTFIDT